MAVLTARVPASERECAPAPATRPRKTRLGVGAAAQGCTLRSRLRTFEKPRGRDRCCGWTAAIEHGPKTVSVSGGHAYGIWPRAAVGTPNVGTSWEARWSLLPGMAQRSPCSPLFHLCALATCGHRHTMPHSTTSNPHHAACTQSTAVHLGHACGRAPGVLIRCGPEVCGRVLCTVWRRGIEKPSAIRLRPRRQTSDSDVRVAVILARASRRLRRVSRNDEACGADGINKRLEICSIAGLNSCVNARPCGPHIHNELDIRTRFELWRLLGTG